MNHDRVFSAYLLVMVITFGHAVEKFSQQAPASDVGYLVQALVASWLWPLYWSAWAWRIFL